MKTTKTKTKTKTAGHEKGCPCLICAGEANTLWIWRWESDGYNSCVAATREEALAKAKALGAPSPMGGGRMTYGLEVAEDTLHAGTYEELSELDRYFSRMFD